MKKIYTIILIVISGFFLSSCQSNLDFDFIIPDKEDYSINEIIFDDFTQSTIIDFDNITEESLLSAQQANIYISNISYNDKWFFSKKDNYTGSGVIFFETESFYYALTNAHVVDKHQDFENHIIEVYDYFNNKYNAFVYEGSFNYDLDLAVLVFYKNEVELTVLNIVYGEIGVGDNIIAIGNPLGEKNVISVGKVIRYNKTRVEDRYGNIKTNEFNSIIHSSKTNAGSSGGMILNFDLKIVGINYGGNRSEENPEGFAVSSKLVIDFLLRII
ncbi:S1 family peptidase [Acholeplasma laidlawii]|uniref:Trypsin-like serine protease, surface anchored n=2 Tax=Acholeplasma laidlawii TaxID=2148 RepID=A9NFW8_ACHLI|nr:serine protease [Acholeplasma laidlawii]ABX81248.1 trypsin-like serine protease, surface anchored [Acholeplasma laidlawii PG-8A]RED20337.1 trypsin-like peptidase [Acholeplasma laidlawii]SQH56849.1 Serine protease Do-like HtrA [Acholeplasma laidlawii]